MSLTVARYIARTMERIAPLSLAEKWDNVGLLIEAPHQPQRSSHNVLLTIDLTTKVLNEALALPATCIIAYHPTIFKPLSSLTLSNPLQATLLKCAAAGISVYAPHTALDAVEGGINDWLAQGLLDHSPGKVEALFDKGLGQTVGGGVGRIVRLEETITMAVLQERVKKHLGLKHIQVALNPATPHKEIQSIAICAGSGESVLTGVDADVYFTGEMGHHYVLAAVASGHNVILCGHSNTERGYLPVLAAKLRHAFLQAQGEEEELVAQQLAVRVSKEDKDPLEVV